MSSATRWLTLIARSFASFVLSALMAVTFIDVLLRNVVGRPVAAAFEITELLLVTLIFAGLPLVSQASEHVVLDTLDGFLPKWIRKSLDRMANVVCAVALAGAAWLMAERARRTAEYGDSSSELGVPYWPFVIVMVVTLFLTALVHLKRSFRGADYMPLAAGGDAHRRDANRAMPDPLL